MFAFCIHRARHRPRRSWPATGSASSRCTWPSARAAAVRLHAARAARRRRRRHLDRPGRAAPLPDLPRRRPARRARSSPASASCRPRRCGSSSPTGAAGSATTGRPEFTRAPRPRGLDRAGLGGRGPRRAPDRRRARLGRRRAGRRAALRRPRLQPHRRPAGRGRVSAAWRPSASASSPPAARRATSSSTPTSSPREFGTDHHQIRVAADRMLPALPRRDRRDERADGQPRRRRLLPAVRGGRQARQGRAVRPGRRRGVRAATTGTRRCAAPGDDRRRHVRQGLLRPHHARPATRC